MGYPTDLTDAQWAFIEPIIPAQEGAGRPRTVDLRRVLDALMYQDRTGCQWRMIPLDFPPSGTVRYYFDKWNEDGTLLEIHDMLRRKVREQQGRNPEPTACIVDSQTVKTTEAGGERGFDGGKQVDGRKRQMVVDTEGNLLTVAVHTANVQDRDGAQPVLTETQELCPNVTYAWADQSYRGDLLEWAAKVLGITIEIVTGPVDQVGFQIQPRRWVVERTIRSRYVMNATEKGTMQITDLQPDDTAAIEQAAQALVIGFREQAPDAWPNLIEARSEVHKALEPGKVCRVARDADGTVLGWIGGQPTYARVWELHPLVLLPSAQRRGIGRALVADLEVQVRQRGGLTIMLGSDDETDMTTLSGVDLYPDVWPHVANIRNLRGHPYEFYRKCGFVIVGVVPDANGLGKPDILMAKRVADS